MTILSKIKKLSSFFYNSLEVAIDLGTSNTRIAIEGKGIILREPTLVGFDNKNADYLFFGNQAKEIRGKTPGYINLIKPIENGIIADFDANVALVEHFLKKSVYPFITAKSLLRPQLIGYSTVPSSATEVEQKALRESLLKAGFTEVFLVEKPLATALGAGHSIFSHKPMFIIDLGGGLIEMAIITLGGVVVQKINKLAGDYLDKLIYNYLHLKYGLIIGEASAESLKINLFNFAEENKILLIRGKSLENRLPKSIRVKSNDIKEALIGHFNQIVDMIKEVLETTPPELIDEIVKNGVVLVGGLANLKGIGDFFNQELRIPVLIPEHPQDATINGLLKLMKNKEKLKRILIK